MAYKSLTTIITSAAKAQPAIAAAGQLAQALDAHLDILALGIDRTQMGYSYLGGGGAVLLQVSVERAEAEATETTAAGRAAATSFGPTLRWGIDSAIAQASGIVDLVALRSRFADLVVLPRPYGQGVGNDAEAVVEAALFEGSAPVLILPDATPLAAGWPKHVVIGWNQSREAMVAIRRALPFLKKAASVNIAVIDPPSHGAERSDPGGALCQMLVRHGVKAEVSVLARTMPRVSDVLNRHAIDQNADLLVMGAYGHSRFREAILGGATRNMLESAELPIFLAH